MFKIRIWIFFLVLACCWACDKEVIVETDPTLPLSEQLAGRWHLVDVSCECGPSQLDAGDHIWQFDLNTNELVVANIEEKPLQILATGIYPFDIDDESITIEQVRYDVYFEGGFLFLADQPEVDGPLMRFVRD